jgi:hypothetical protein
MHFCPLAFSLPPRLWGKVGVGGLGEGPGSGVVREVVTRPTLALPHRGGGDRTAVRTGGAGNSTVFALF